MGIGEAVARKLQLGFFLKKLVMSNVGQMGSSEKLTPGDPKKWERTLEMGIHVFRI